MAHCLIEELWERFTQAYITVASAQTSVIGLYYSRRGLVLGTWKLTLLEVGRRLSFENTPVLPRADLLVADKEKP